MTSHLSARWLRGKRGLPSTFGVNVMNMAFGVVTGIATARGLAPDDRGLLLALTLWASVVATVSLVGLDEAIVFGADGSVREAYRLRTALAPHVRNQVLVGLLVLAVVDGVILEGPSISLLWAALAVASVVPLNAYIQLSMAPLRSGERFGTWNALRLLPAGIYATCTVILVVADELTVLTGVLALVGGNLVSAAGCWFVTSRVGRDVPSVRPAVASARRYGRTLLVANLPYVLSQRLDQLILGVVLPPRNLGIYAVAVSIAAVLQMVGVTLEQVMFPRLVAGTLTTARVTKVLVTATAVTLVAAVPFAVFSTQLISIVYGPAYREAAGPLNILLLGVIFLVATAILTAEAKAQGRLRDLMAAQISGTVIILLAVPTLVLRYGLTGAASASAGAYATVALILLVRRRAVLRTSSRPGGT